MARDKAYRKAERKIEAARQSGATTLDLSVSWNAAEQSKLTELPDSISELTQLQSLDLTRNSLTVLPESMGQLAQLQSLRVSHNYLTQLPRSLVDLTQLQYLDLSNNQLRALPKSVRQLMQLLSLNISGIGLTEVPGWLSELSQLQSLNLASNGLRAVQEGLGDLTQLESLDLSGNELSTLPESLTRLKRLQSLRLQVNALTALPESLGRMTSLTEINIAKNQITELPDSIVELSNLTHLYIGVTNGNPLSSLPPSFEKLTKLQVLDCTNCLFADLPQSLSKLSSLRNLDLTGNPLNPELAAAYEIGLDAVRRYLLELAKGRRKRYEAKLLILGDGNEGKTCVSRAIRGLPFKPQVTTRGVDVEQWKFGHPDHAGDGDKEITLNIWDFEGQEINHQTHQFFLTTQSLYILVFKCRDQFPMDRAEYWLDTIRARAPQAKVAIVISESEKRTPYVPQDKLRAQYGDLLGEGDWLFAVGCEDNSGVAALQDSLKRCAADLEFMGREWPESYSKAEEAIKGKAQEGTSHISRNQLYGIFGGCSIDESIHKDLAASMSTLGVMTQFPDCPDLRDFIVLQPQWLTKAISEIMEDKQLTSDKGEIALRRMASIWEDNGYVGLFPTFHDCMKEFELCYDLEDASRSCLVPLRFGYERPQIPWSDGNAVRERRVEYKLNIRPPMGLMSRFIVKTHHMMVATAAHPKGVYWHNGVFLRTGSGHLASEALCEFDSDARKLRVQVRAAFPQNLLEQIHGYVKAVFSFFSGLDAQRSYGCIKRDEQADREEKCIGVHSESRIYSAIRKQRVLDCEYEFHDVEPQKLIWGFSSFGEYVMAKVASIDELREELDKRPEWAEALTQDIEKLLGWVEQHDDRMKQLVDDQENLLPEFKQQLELKLHEYLAYTSEMFDAREDAAAPGIISIGTKDRSKWNPAAYFSKTFLLTPFCESSANIHPCEEGQVEFTKDRQWWEKTAPWVARGTKVLAVGLQLAFAGMPLALGRQVFDTIKDDVDFMKELTKHIDLPDEAPEGNADVLEAHLDKDLRGAGKESRLMRVALARFLEETAPTNYHARQWGSLSRVRMSDNSYRWLCEAHNS